MELQNEVVVDPVVISDPVAQVPAEPAFVDPMAAELAEVQAAIKAEENSQASAEAQAQPVTTASAVATPLKLEPKPAGDATTAALISMRKSLKEAQTHNLLLTGQVQALAAIAQGQHQPAGESGQVEARAEPIDPLQDVRAQKIALAEKFDAGDISAKVMESERQRLDDREWEIRRASFQPAPVQPQSDLQLEQQTASLETKFPVLSILTVEDLAPLATIARRNAERNGMPFAPNAMGTLQLRTRVAEMAQSMYGGGTSQATPQAQPLSPEAQARADKLAFAANLPPDVTKMGSAASDTLTSESEVLSRMEGMSEEQQWALLKTLPVSARQTLGMRR